MTALSSVGIELLNTLHGVSQAWVGRAQKVCRVLREIDALEAPAAIPWIVPYALDHDAAVVRETAEVLERLFARVLGIQLPALDEAMRSHTDH